SGSLRSCVRRFDSSRGRYLLQGKDRRHVVGGPAKSDKEGVRGGTMGSPTRGAAAFEAACGGSTPPGAALAVATGCRYRSRSLRINSFLPIRFSWKQARAAVRQPSRCLARRSYGVSLLVRVDQFASPVRFPGPWLAPPQVPSRLSPLPPAKNGPPHDV